MRESANRNIEVGHIQVTEHERRDSSHDENREVSRK